MKDIKVLISGGAGFIGSAVTRMMVVDGSQEVVNIDALMYASNLESLADVDSSSAYRFGLKKRSDIE